MTSYPDLFADLAAPFDAHEVKTRIQANRQFHYITARTAMNRLDSVLGPENWWDEYVPSENSVLCRLTIRLPNGETITKQDAGGYAGMADSGDDEKSAYSDAFKRACAKFGVGRYLYGDGIPRFRSNNLPVAQDQVASAGIADNLAPSRPELDGGRFQPRGAAPSNGRGSQSPRSGKALFAWTKEQDQRYEFGLLKYLNGWGKLHDFPNRMVEWDAEQVAMAHGEASRKLAELLEQEATVGASH